MVDRENMQPSEVQSEKKRLMALSDLVHEAVRMLKIGDKGSISLGQFSFDEVRGYLAAYGGHKHKWFEIERYDKTARIMYVVRGQPLPHDKPKQETKEEAP